MKFFRVISIAALLLLGGCSYTFDLIAVMIDGKLAFQVAVGSPRKPSCVNGVWVTLDKPPPSPADAEGFDQWKDSASYDCANPFPIFYGQALRGEPSPKDLAGKVEARPLQPGVIYSVMMTSGATGYGGGRFRLTADGRVENLPAGRQ